MKKIKRLSALIISLIMIATAAITCGANDAMRKTAGPFSASNAAPAIDGTIDYSEGWSKGTVLDITNLGDNYRLNGDISYPLTVFSAYDKDNFYFAAEMTDKTFSYSDGIEEYKPSRNSYLGFNGDLFAVSIDPMGLFNRFEFNDYEDYLPTYSFGLYENGETRVYSSHYKIGEITEGISAEASVTNYGWCIEVAIPIDMIITDTLDALDTLAPGMIQKVNDLQTIINECIEAGIPAPRQLIDGIDSSNVKEYANNAEKYIRENLTKENLMNKNNTSKILFIYEDKAINEDTGEVVTIQRYSTIPFRLRNGLQGSYCRGLCIQAIGADFTLGDNAFSVPFADIKGKWFERSVSELYFRGYVSGTGADTFSPDLNMSRADFVTILGRLDKVDVKNYGDTNFSDVPYKQYYTAYIDWANKNNIVSGLGGGLFGTKNNIARQQIAVILYNFSKFKGYDTSYDENILSGYKGVENISSWALEAMKWAVTNGIINGDANKDLLPAASASRAQVAQLLYNFSKNISNII